MHNLKGQIKIKHFHTPLFFSFQRKKGCKKVTYQYNPRKKECKIEKECENVCKNVWKPPGNFIF